MGRYIGPVCRFCRREGMKLYLKGERCYTEKCALERRNYPPGDQGARRKMRKMTEYGRRLREKQKLKRMYNMREEQFVRFFEMAARMREGQVGENLMRLLERRLDNVVYRLGFAASRNQARQIVRHGHILVNGKKVDIPSYLVKEGDVITVSEKSQDFIKKIVEANANEVPAWLESNKEALTGKVVRYPTREEMDTRINERLIVEFYSR